MALYAQTSARADCTKLMLYGGDNSDVYLGCLNCGTYDSESISNKYGTYGGQYSSSSIWNKYGTYGSSYSNNSPWNKYASSPPIIVDECGKFYGKLTINEYTTDRASLPEVLAILAQSPFASAHSNNLSSSSVGQRDSSPARGQYYEPTSTDPKKFDDMVAPDEGLVAADAALQGILAGLQAGMAVREAKKAALVTSSEVEAYMAGEFTGWNGKTKFTLSNGQQWKQDDRGNKIKVNLSWPRVLLRQMGSGSEWYKLDLFDGDRRVAGTFVKRTK